MRMGVEEIRCVFKSICNEGLPASGEGGGEHTGWNACQDKTIIGGEGGGPWRV